MLHDYPRLHADWKRQGRVLLFCPMSIALGNLLRSLPSVVLLAVQLDLALVLHCDQPFREKAWSVSHHATGVAIDVDLSRHFEGPHFDWRGSFALPRNNATDIYLHGKVDASVEFHRHALGPRRAYAHTETHLSALLVDKRNLARAAALLGDELAALDSRRLAGCLLRYVLAPSERLRRGESALRLPAVGRHGLRQQVVAHVRMGDSAFFAHGNGSAGLGGASDDAAHYVYGRERRALAYRLSPARTMRCLMRAAQLPAGRCLGCAVVSDAQEVERCARIALASPLLSPGVAVHPLASPAAQHGQASLLAWRWRGPAASPAASHRSAWQPVAAPRVPEGALRAPLSHPTPKASNFAASDDSQAAALRDRRNEDKAFLDWWLLGTSRAALVVGGFAAWSRPHQLAFSTFASTALGFRDAACGFADGSCWTVMLGADPWRHGWERRCAKGAVVARRSRPGRTGWVAQERVLAPDTAQGGVEDVGTDVSHEIDSSVEA